MKTHEECWTAALAVGANGAAIEKVCPDKCWCYAYWASDGWGHGTYLGCIFYPGEQSLNKADAVEFFSEPYKLFLYL